MNSNNTVIGVKGNDLKIDFGGEKFSISYDNGIMIIKDSNGNDKEIELVKTKKYVDMDALESAIYNGRVQAESLKPYQIVKPDIVTLKLTQSKILKG